VLQLVREKLSIMIKLVVLTFVLFLTSPCLAENHTYTNDDLERYNKNPDAIREETPEPSFHIDMPDNINESYDEKDEEIRQLKDHIEHLENALKGPPKVIQGKECEVIDYSAWTDSYAVFNPDINAVVDGVAYGTVVAWQRAKVSARNDFGLIRWVKDFKIVAVFQDRSELEGTLEPVEGDSPNRQIHPGESYTGYVKFRSDSPIVSLGCRMNPGL
jgi:hypothetical protein